MTSVEIPYSIAAALPSLAVLDITNEVAHEVAACGFGSGIAYVSSGAESLVRVNEREGGFFCDLEALLLRLVPEETDGRERLLAMLARNPGSELWYGRPAEEEVDPELDAAMVERAALALPADELLEVAPLRMAELGIR